MKKVISDEQKPIKLWLDHIEEGALQQARNIANLPFTFKHVALMPDSHVGYGMPIGGVLATKGVVIPNAVGVDIGCGMCAMQTNLTELTQEELKESLGEIRKVVPVGFNRHEEKRPEEALPDTSSLPKNGIVLQQYEKARKQVGTLGGGNHFIEIQKGSDGRIWVMIHSGSRNLGLQVANHYNALAKKLNTRWHSNVNPKHDLAYLPIEEQAAKDYLAEMQYCVDFAFANRLAMMQAIKGVLSEQHTNFEETDFINIAHNYAAWEHHFKNNVIVHRKGATRAYEGERGIIPGSQGTPSFIVQGKGNPESFMSCSHGAGRLLGRKQAQRTLKLDEQQALLDTKGIVHGIRHKSDLDEAPGAYKDIHTVMENQQDLVEVLVELQPLAVLKG